MREKLEWAIAYAMAWAVWLGTIPTLMIIGQLLGGI